MRHIFTSTLVGALAMASVTALPARATDKNDLAKIAVGLAGLAALYAIVDNNRDKSPAAARKTQSKPPVLTVKRRHRPHIDYSQCLRQRHNGYRWETFVSNRCVNRLQRQAGTLKAHPLRPAGNTWKKAGRLSQR